MNGALITEADWARFQARKAKFEAGQLGAAKPHFHFSFGRWRVEMVSMQSPTYSLSAWGICPEEAWEMLQLHILNFGTPNEAYRRIEGVEP